VIWGGLAGLAITIIGGLTVLFVTAPALYPVLSYPDPASRLNAIAALRSAALAGFVGFAALGTLLINALNTRVNTENLRVAQNAQATAQRTAAATAKATRRTLDLTERGELTDRYIAAIELMGSEKINVRLGGLYALEQLAMDSLRSGDHRTVVEVLSAYVRSQSPRLESRTEVDSGASTSEESDSTAPHPEDVPQPRAQPADVQAAITILARLPAGAPAADLSGSSLRHAAFTKAVLRGARLRGADLTKASFSDADFADADFTDAVLIGASFYHTDLSKTYFHGSDLTKALFMNSKTVAGASLVGATLTGAGLGGADFTGADLRYADLTEASLAGTILAKANLTGATLTRATMGGAELTDTNLRQAKGSPLRPLTYEQRGAALNVPEHLEVLL